MERQITFAKQMLGLQRIMVDAMASNVLIILDQTERMLGNFVNGTTWTPPASKAVFKDWIEHNKQGCDALRNAASDGFNMLEGFLNRSIKQ